MLIGLVAEEGGGGEEEESHSKVGTLLGPTNMLEWQKRAEECSQQQEEEAKNSFL